MEPFVSVIVPVYNISENLLNKCISSLMSQDLINIEIIIVDDGSDDDCANLCDYYKSIDERVAVIHKNNEGLSAARNTGVRCANGKWITFVDGDDWIEKNALLHFFNYGEKFDVEIVCWGIAKDFLDKTVFYKHAKYLKNGKVYSDFECSYLQELLFQYDACFATAYAKLIRKDFINENNIYHDEVLRQGFEGLEFCFRLFGQARKIVYIDRHWYHYSYNSESISSCSSDQNTEYIVECLRKIRLFIESSRNKKALMEKFNNRILYVIITTAISGYFHPKNYKNYYLSRDKFIKFLNNDIIIESLNSQEHKKLDLKRKVILFFIKNKMVYFLRILALIRLRQKNSSW